MSSRVIDTFIVYQFVKRIATPFNETDAFGLGLIDADGKLLKKASTNEERKAYTLFDRLVFNIKRILQKARLDNKYASIAGAMLLMREDRDIERLAYYDDDELIEELIEEMGSNYSTISMLVEDAPTMSTGAAVAGTGDDAAHWKSPSLKIGPYGDKKRKGRYINGVAYLKRYAKAKNNG